MRKVTLTALDSNATQWHKIKVHKAVLCARSPVFERMFRFDALQNNMLYKLTIPDININALKVFIDYYYFAEYYFSDIYHAIGVYKVANMYEVNIFKRHCVTYLCMHLSKENLKLLLDFSLSDKEELRSAIRAHLHNCKHHV